MTPAALAALHAQASASPWSASSFDEVLCSSGSLLTTKDNAFALGRMILDDVELLQIATDPAHQRQGLGRSVLSTFERQARSFGCRRALLEVASKNFAAIALYTASGWQTDGMRPKYYRTSDGIFDDAILMSKNI